MRTLSIKSTKVFLIHLVLICVCFIAIFPVLYTLMTSLKGEIEVLTKPPRFFPTKWVFTGYQQVFTSSMVTSYLPNTLFNSLLSTLICIPLASLAAYGFSRYRFTGSNILQLLILMIWMVPRLTTLLPLYKISSTLRLLQTRIPLVAVYATYSLPVSIWIIKSFIDAIPKDMEEAALLDGANFFQTFWHILVPLTIPGIFTSFLMAFVEAWNEFLAAVVLISNNDLKTATVGLYDFQSSFETSYHTLAAACIVIAIPILCVFIAGRKYFFEGLLEGAVKG